MTNLLSLFSSFAAASAPPAGGAAATEVLIATLIGGGIFSTVVVIALLDRNGKISWLKSAGAFAGKQLNLPPWAAVPLVVLTTSLICAVFGLYWDVSLHLSKGRDPGPLANPSHYFILLGLLGCFSAGVFAITMPKPGDKPSPWAIKLAEGWYAPVGGVLIAASAAFGLIGFPLDDFWHRMFGQDVTLWGPTHLLMLSGAGLTLIGAMVLLTEGGWARANEKTDDPNKARNAVIMQLRKASAAGGLLIGLSIFQGEFDYGIAQFQMVFDPMMVMFAAGLALVFARVWIGKGGALMAATFFVVVRGALTLIVAEGFNRPVAHFPLYLGCALVVELIGLAMAGSIKSKPLTFAAVAGLGVGTIGLASEWGFSHLWAVYPWTASLLPEGAIVGIIAALSGAFIGAWMANSLALRPKLSGSLRWAPIAGVFAVILMTGWGLHQTEPKNVTATITTQKVDTGKPGTWITATAKLNTTYFDNGTKWAKQLAWQGPGFVVNDLVRTGPGVYKTTEPMPAFGKWKSMLRFHAGNSLMGVALYEPADAAIPAAEVPALPQFTREMQPDRAILQRESKISGGLVSSLAYLAIFLIAMSLLAALGWGIWRVSQPMTEEQASTDDSDAKPSPAKRTQQSPTARPQTT
jgi:hypothetical protein